VKPITILTLTLTLLISISNKSAAQVVSTNSNQKIDTLETKKNHSVTRATIYSLILPGAGQVYNKKYWKVPIIYAGMGASIFLALANNNDFKRFRDAYRTRVDGGTDEFAEVLLDNTLRSRITSNQRNRDFAFIVAGIFYALNIIDAAVDAHLFSFPKNDDLTFRIQPNLQITDNSQLSKGLSLVISL